MTDPSLGVEKEKTGHCLGLEASQGGWNLRGWVEEGTEPSVLLRNLSQSWGPGLRPFQTELWPQQKVEPGHWL